MVMMMIEMIHSLADSFVVSLFGAADDDAGDNWHHSSSIVSHSCSQKRAIERSVWSSLVVLREGTMFHFILHVDG